MIVNTADESQAERLAAELRLAIEARSTRPCFNTAYTDGATTRESDCEVDESQAIFTVLFEGVEYDVHITTANEDV